MDLYAWKRFNFFDVFPVDLGEEERALFSNQSCISTIATGTDHLFVGSEDGKIYVLGPSLRLIRSFEVRQGYPIAGIAQLGKSNYIISITDNDPIVVAVWSLSSIRGSAPHTVSRLKIKNSERALLTAFDTLHIKNSSIIVIGFTTGKVISLQGNFVENLGMSQQTIFESKEPVTGIKFVNERSSHVYVTTTGSTNRVNSRGPRAPPWVLKDDGCAMKCMTIDPSQKDLVVSRDGTIAYYNLHTQTRVLSTRGQPQIIGQLDGYLVMVRSGDQGKKRITILNSDLQFIAYEDNIQTSPREIFSKWGDLFVIQDDKENPVIRYHEKIINQRLDILFQQNQYNLAFALAQRLKLDSDTMNIVYRNHGDYWYQKQDYDTAMQQYIRAITVTEPSQVIRKYLDAQRNHNLVDYLEELHNHRMATSEHTTLLLTYYAKCGHFDQAAFLARKFDMHDTVVDILVVDSKKHAEAVAYISRLEPNTAYRNMAKYVTVLLDYDPEETTSFLTKFHTGTYQPKRDIVIRRPKSELTEKSPTTTGGRALAVVQSLASIIPLPQVSLGGGATESAAEPPPESESIEEVQTTVDGAWVDYEIPKPRSVFSAFLNHPTHFITFLETCSESEKIVGTDREDIYTTLFEMYLHQSRNLPDERERWEAKAKALIDKPDSNIKRLNVLLLSDLENYPEGITLVREQEGLRFDIFRSYMAAKDTAGVIKTLHQYGGEEPELYALALKYFTSSSEILKEAKHELGNVLREVDRKGLLAPLQVVQTLAASVGTNGDIVTVGLIAPYLSRVISQQQTAIATNKNEIEKIRTERDGLDSEIERLQNETMEAAVTRCQACRQTMKLPAVHFKCQHSYHLDCLNEMAQPNNLPGLVQEDLGLGLTTGAVAAEAGPSSEGGEVPVSATMPVPGRGPVGLVEAGSGKMEWKNKSGKEVTYSKYTCYVCEEKQNRELRKRLMVRHEDAHDREGRFEDALQKSRDPVDTIATWFGKGVF